MFPFSNPTDTKLCQALKSVLRQCSLTSSHVKEMTICVFCTCREEKVGKTLHEPAPFLLESGDNQLPLLNPECTIDNISRAAQPLVDSSFCLETITAGVTTIYCVSSKKTMQIPSGNMKIPSLLHTL